MKVFGVGLPKTATASLDRALKQLGLRVTGPNQDLYTDVLSGELSGVIQLSQIFDGFQDWPWPLVYREMNELYGGDARFILTLRKTPEAWFNSLCSHAMRYRAPFHNHRQMWGYFYPFGRQAEHIERYNRHRQEVLAYFDSVGARERLLEVSFDSGEGWPELCRFLSLPEPGTPFPHANSTQSKKFRPVRYGLNYVLGGLYQQYATVSRREIDGERLLNRASFRGRLFKS